MNMNLPRIRPQCAALLLGMAGIAAASSAWACTRLVFHGANGQVVTARSMDWKNDITSNLWVLPRGMARSGEAGPNSLRGTSRYGSVVTSGYDVSTTDGVNEVGLSANLLWLANGVVFVVLLFVSGHWARIVPTSWEVFPNALSAALQYGTMEWPMEDAWVNYNALQQLMYFIIVFIAAPLAAITGVRMSEWWPKNATTLNKIYPAPLARAMSSGSSPTSAALLAARRSAGAS